MKIKESIIKNPSVIAKSRIPLKALILAGGRSRRMGTDKSKIVFHQGMSQQVYMAEMCRKTGLDTYVSKSFDYSESQIEGFRVIKDIAEDQGPFCAVLSAMKFDPDCAWMVLACDLPFIDEGAIMHLQRERSEDHDITAYKMEDRKVAEPLMAIYEPKLLGKMEEWFEAGIIEPRRLITECNTKIVVLKDAEIAINVNTKAELKRAKNKLGQKDQ